jgi:hypothetical protein
VTDHFGDLDVYGRKILKHLKKWSVRIWTGLTMKLVNTRKTRNT